MRPFYVFDLDGTLADCQHRVEAHLTNGKDWPAFFAACPADKPISHVIELLLRLWNTKAVRIEIWSGRSDEVRRPTEEWLCANGISPNLLTRMRKAGDHRPDDVIKREFLEDSDARPDIIFDDRDRVVAMWRYHGVPCFQVADGEF